LLTKELGVERTKEFLDAHEANPLQSDSERDMDKFNNEKFASSAQNPISNKNWSLENLEKSGLDSLRSKDLKVPSPGLKILRYQNEKNILNFSSLFLIFMSVSVLADAFFQSDFM
jgi:hypothetical protein